MDDAYGAPGRVSGRAQPRPASNHGASNHGASDHGAPNHGAHDHELLAALDLEEKVRLLTGADNWRTCPLPAIGLRAMVMSDGPAGVRGQTMDERNPSASLPCPSALGATWDPALVRELAFALGAEAKSKGVDVLLAPTINVMRTPLGGRGFESFGEDPVLIARMAVAYVDGLRQAGVAAAAKHYVGNDSETQRWTYDARIAEHVLRELYLVPFEACVREADLDVVMTGYNMVNGITMTEHPGLLSAILKREWGFQGVALSDWHAARTTVATATAGLDLAMPGPSGPWGGLLTAAVRAGEVSEDEVDAKVLRILRLARRVGALGPDGAAAEREVPGGQRPGRYLPGRHLSGRAPGARRPGTAAPGRGDGVHAAAQRGRRCWPAGAARPGPPGAAARSGRDRQHRADRAQRGQPGHPGRRQRERPPGQRVDPGGRADRGAGRPGPGDRAAGLRDLEHRAGA